MWISDRRRPGEVRVKRPEGWGLRGSRGDQRHDTRQSGLWERHGIAQLNRLMHDLTDGAVLRIVRSARVGVARRHDRTSHQRDRQGYAKHAPDFVPSQRMGTSHRVQIAFLISRVPVRSEPPDKCLGWTVQGTVASAVSPKWRRRYACVTRRAQGCSRTKLRQRLRTDTVQDVQPYASSI